MYMYTFAVHGHSQQCIDQRRRRSNVHRAAPLQVHVFTSKRLALYMYHVFYDKCSLPTIASVKTFIEDDTAQINLLAADRQT